MAAPEIFCVLEWNFHFWFQLNGVLMIRVLRLFLMVWVVALLGACASGVTRMDGGPGKVEPKIDKNVKSVSVWLNPDAKKLVADNPTFSKDKLKLIIEASLNASDLVKPESGQTLDIEITGFRVRSAFAAIMFGFMAGNDNIEGIVSIKNSSGVVLKKAKVGASYALGGLAGGQDDSRMNWLYSEFSKFSVAELTGVPVN